MTLRHSKTWPVNTVAVVQLRVDPNGRAYSTFMDQRTHLTSSQTPLFLHQEKPKSASTANRAARQNTSAENGNGIILPFSKQHLDLLRIMYPYKSIRTDTVSTIVEQELENDSENQNEANEDLVEENSIKNTAEEEGNYDKIQVLALAKIDEISNESDIKNNIVRRPSIKVDNWDLVYTENNKLRCQKHPSTENAATTVTTTNTYPCKSKSIGTCNEHTDCLLPEIPLDARKVTTLRRHYYPEGGWGWVIVVCSVLVHILNNGIQLSCSQLVLPAAEKFKTLPVHVAGSIYYFSIPNAYFLKDAFQELNCKV